MPAIDRLLHRTARPWADEHLHQCVGRAKKTFLLSPVAGRKTMVVSCTYCKRKWPHPGGEELFAAFLAGYRTARQHVNTAADQMSVAIVGVQA